MTTDDNSVTLLEIKSQNIGGFHNYLIKVSLKRKPSRFQNPLKGQARDFQ